MSRSPRWPGIGILLISLVSAGCASRESLGTHSLSILGAGVVNDPKNKSLRFDVLSFGLQSFCDELQKVGAPLRMGDDEPVMGRFYAHSCSSQVIDDEARQSFVIQYSGVGFSTSAQGGRIGFSTSGLVEYTPDFLLEKDRMYVYFRPRVVDASGFNTLLVESELAKSAFKLFGVNADAFGRRVVEAELRRGFTVIRYGERGETEFSLGTVPLGEHPARPFSVKSAKRVLANERTEVHRGQQDYLGPFAVDSDDEALYLTMVLDGTPAADVLVVPEATGRAMLEKLLKEPGAPAPSGPAALDEPLVQGGTWKRYVLVPKGKYYVVFDNSGAAGRSAPPPSSDGAAHSARIDALVLLGDAP